jgi:hypothetical protein
MRLPLWHKFHFITPLSLKKSVSFYFLVSLIPISYSYYYFLPFPQLFVRFPVFRLRVFVFNFLQLSSPLYLQKDGQEL